MANRIIPLILIFTPWVSNAQVIPVNYGDFYLQYDCEIEQL